METKIKIFSNVLFGQVRSIVDESGEPWFCLADVCNALGLQSFKVVQRLESSILSKYSADTGYGIKEINFVNEDGLYDVILDSRKPEAKKFRKWITSEVLPSIRKDGGYMVSKEEESEEELLARAMRVAQRTIERQQERMRLMAQEHERKEAIAEERLRLQERELQQAQVKVDYHDKVLNSESTYAITQIAKEFGMGGVTLNRKLEEMKVQYKVNDQWLLTSKYAEKGYTKSMTNSYTDRNGMNHSVQHTMWTERGRKFIHELLNKE